MKVSATARRRVLLSLDKFKGALAADQACAVVARVLGRRCPAWELDLSPLTDGGDGFCSVLTESARGEFQPVLASGSQLEAANASRVATQIGVVEHSRVPSGARELIGYHGGERIAIVEMALINGLARVPRERRDVWRASSYGTGELLRRASELADVVLLGVGGSATSDLGLGALAALGLSFEDASGRSIHPLPALWPRISAERGSIDVPLAPIVIACDVDNPLLGPRGAAAVYGPQKGLEPRDVPRFDREAARVAQLVCEHLSVELECASAPGAGAAGGIAFGLAAAAGARLVPGFELVWHWLDLEARMRRADLIITGEGRFDASSLAGKGPGALLERAQRFARPAVLFAGSVEAEAAESMAARSMAASGARVDAAEQRVVTITPAGIDTEHAMAYAASYLEAAVERWLDECLE